MTAQQSVSISQLRFALEKRDEWLAAERRAEGQASGWYSKACQCFDEAFPPGTRVIASFYQQGGEYKDFPGVLVGREGDNACVATSNSYIGKTPFTKVRYREDAS
ncbi:hypothetical protein OPIT5_04000 [Opitutaceae bacterium TAV5]|nr:hypothetical protein OPIT5_04000 [Opitutaceae bacterium TAV5]